MSNRLRRLVLDLKDTRPVWALPDWVVTEIRGALPDEWELQIVNAATDGRGDGAGPSPQALEATRGAEVYVGYGIDPALFKAATEPPHGRLRWVHSAAAGVRASLHADMLASKVIFTNSAGVHAEPIADTVLAMTLYFLRGLDFAVRAQAMRQWCKNPFDAADTPVSEISGITMGIIGFGGIGRGVARRAASIGMRVAAIRRTPVAAPADVEMLTGPDRLDRLLEESQVLVLTVPETAETRGMIGEAELSQLPPGAVLINVSRGAVVDEGALIAALHSGRLRGAGLDVFAREPLPPDSPLWELPGVLVMPHVSGTSHRFWRRQADLILDNLDRYLRGEPMLNVVRKQAGY